MNSTFPTHNPVDPLPRPALCALPSSAQAAFLPPAPAHSTPAIVTVVVVDLGFCFPEVK